MMILGLTCGAGHPRGDGWLVLGEDGDGGLMMGDSTEILELLYPLIALADELVTDSGGPERFRGAPACYVEYGPAGTSFSAMWSTDGFVNPAQGARGGWPGAPARQSLCRADGTIEPLPGWGEIQLQAGDTVIATSSAGAGYAPPWERSPERVLRGVHEGHVSLEQARSVYGGVFDARGQLAMAATAACREALVTASAPPPALLEIDAEHLRIAQSLAGFVKAPTFTPAH